MPRVLSAHASLAWLAVGFAACSSDPSPLGGDASIAVDRAESIDGAPPADAAAPDASDAPDGGPAPDASTGCTPDPSLSGLVQDRTLEHAGLTRRFDVYVPPAISSGAPLVLDFHGYNATEDQQRLLSGFQRNAEAERFVAIWPAGRDPLQAPMGGGSGRSWSGGECCPPALYDASDPDDVGFTRALIDWAAARLCIDPSRVYAAGMSNGGWLAQRLGCELTSLAAVAAVSSTGPVEWPECRGFTDQASCTRTSTVCAWTADGCARQVAVGENVRTVPVSGFSYDCPARSAGMPIILFHGTADRFVPIEGSRSPWGRYSSVDETLAHWLGVNGCDPVATSSVTYGCGSRCDPNEPPRDMVCWRYEQCTRAPVQLCLNYGGGHCWPGTGMCSQAEQNGQLVRATDLIWSLFSAHHR